MANHDLPWPYAPHGVGFKRVGSASEEAAIRLSPRAPIRREIVFDRLTLAGVVGMTADELALALGWTVLSTRPRCTELRELGRIMETGERRKAPGATVATTVYKVAPLEFGERGGD